MQTQHIGKTLTENQPHYVLTHSEELGGEKHGPYRSFLEALGAQTRLQVSAERMNDGITRSYRILSAAAYAEELS